MKLSTKIINILVILALIVGALWLYFRPEVASATFPDISGSPYKVSIEFLQNRGVVEGYPDGTFGPERKINRAEIMKIILEATRMYAATGLPNMFVMLSKRGSLKVIRTAVLNPPKTSTWWKH